MPQQARIEVTEQAREPLNEIIKKESATGIRLFVEGFG